MKNDEKKEILDLWTKQGGKEYDKGVIEKFLNKEDIDEEEKKDRVEFLKDLISQYGVKNIYFSSLVEICTDRVLDKNAIKDKIKANFDWNNRRSNRESFIKEIKEEKSQKPNNGGKCPKQPPVSTSNIDTALINTWITTINKYISITPQGDDDITIIQLCKYILGSARQNILMAISFNTGYFIEKAHLHSDIDKKAAILEIKMNEADKLLSNFYISGIDTTKTTICGHSFKEILQKNSEFSHDIYAMYNASKLVDDNTKNAILKKLETIKLKQEGEQQE